MVPGRGPDRAEEQDHEAVGEAGNASLGTARPAHQIRLHLRCDLPANISIVAIPSKSPELNPQENVWQFMRDNWLSNRVFGSYDEIVDHCCDAWNRLVDQPWRIMSLGLRDWAHRY